MNRDPSAERRARHAEAILRAAIASADPAPHVRSAIDAATGLADAARITLLSIGKAAASMAGAALATLPRSPDRSLVILPHGTEPHADLPARILHAAHPIPDATSAGAGLAARELLEHAEADDIVLALLSGGASSLCVQPVGDITIDEYAAVVRALLHAGADIVQLNTVRAHIDALKGGGMATLAAPARVLAFIVSDVVGNPPDIIASGPFSPPASSSIDAERVLHALALDTHVPDAVRRALRARRPAGRFDHTTVRVILDNRSALDGAATAASRLGYEVRVAPDPLTGEARDAGARIADAAVQTARTLAPADRPVCMLWGGETTVVVRGAGVGGRNQELALAAALALRDVAGITVGSVGTDGRDGATDAAGAIADGTSVARGAHVGRDAALSLDHNDSHTYFSNVGDLIVTGATGTNVMDVQVALIDPTVSDSRAAADTR